MGSIHTGRGAPGRRHHANNGNRLWQIGLTVHTARKDAKLRFEKLGLLLSKAKRDAHLWRKRQKHFKLGLRLDRLSLCQRLPHSVWFTCFVLLFSWHDCTWVAAVETRARGAAHEGRGVALVSAQTLCAPVHLVPAARAQRRCNENRGVAKKVTIHAEGSHSKTQVALHTKMSSSQGRR